jgi:hypothetical protein
MVIASDSSFFGVRRLMRAVLMIGFFFSGTLIIQASKLLLYSLPGGPMQYNGHGAVLTENGFVSLVGVTFELPEAVRIESIRVWINGASNASVSIEPVPNVWEEPFYHTIPVELVSDAPAKWQGIGSLRWYLQPGSYQLFLQAPDIPYGFGYHGPVLTPAYDIQNFHDYAYPDEKFAPGFGLQVYGSQLSAIPEPSLFGLMGCLVLVGIAARRRFANTSGVLIERKSGKGSV